MTTNTDIAAYTLPNGEVVVNANAHSITLVMPGGEPFFVPPSGAVIRAQSTEAVVDITAHGTELVRSTYSAAPDAEAVLAAIEAAHPGALVIGSVIAAEVFAGRVVSMLPVLGSPPSPPTKRANEFGVFDPQQGKYLGRAGAG